MLILPLGHEQDTVRRLPFVTFAIMGLCTLAFVMTTFGAGSTSDLEDALEESLEFYFEHPYLELDEEFRRQVFGDENEFIAIQLEIMKEVIRPDEDSDVAEEQAELDRLVGNALSTYDEHPLRRFGLVPSSLGVVPFVTHMFLHGGWLHLFGNMLFLYLAGPFIEDIWGRPLYAGFYLASGFAAAVAHIVNFSDSTVPMIGASGAIAGVMGAFLIRFATTKIKFFYWFGFWVRGTFWAPAWLMLPLWFVEQLFMASMTSSLNIEGGVGYWAHVGGFAFGAAATLVIVRTGFEEDVLRPRIEAVVDETVLSNPAIERAQRARSAGAYTDAWTILGEALAADPRNRDAAVALWDLALAQKWEPQAAPVMVRVIDDELRAGDVDLAMKHWFEVVGRVPSIAAEASLLLRIAKICKEKGWTEWLHDSVSRLLAIPPARVSTKQLLLAAELTAATNPDLGNRALAAVGGRGDLHPDEESRAQELREKLPSVVPGS